MTVVPIVEGHGEQEAAPVLVRRLRDLAEAFEIDVRRPFRRRRSELVQEVPFRAGVRRALREPNCGAILVILDSDDECPKEAVPALQEWAQDEARPTPCAVVMAHREYEAWFLAAAESLRGVRGVRQSATAPPDPEGRRDAKGELRRMMEPGRSYNERADQPAFTARFDMAVAYARCRSFRKMVKAFGDLAAAMGAELPTWPPADWLVGEA